MKVKVWGARGSVPAPGPQMNRYGGNTSCVQVFLDIPHYVLLFFLTIGAFFAAIFAWFAILFTGRYPRSLFDFIEGVIRWYNRVGAYAFLLVTDRYPPFSLQP
jgi:hypothetical protein